MYLNFCKTNTFPTETLFANRIWRNEKCALKTFVSRQKKKYLLLDCLQLDFPIEIINFDQKCFFIQIQYWPAVITLGRLKLLTSLRILQIVEAECKWTIKISSQQKACLTGFSIDKGAILILSVRLEKCQCLILFISLNTFYAIVSISLTNILSQEWSRLLPQSVLCKSVSDQRRNKMKIDIK